ncbi:MAG TPA: DUF4256 domain-containing protein [Phycisphaerales bacterium]|nr:DUF4256 domain-containing protein [Phycisphaerales bacterium]HMP38032.1 DUF4256 domain-containing protein [Phycisphaerales bacterium]
MKRPAREGDDEALLHLLKSRFDANPGRHRRIRWSEVERRLRASPSALATLKRMELSGGEPDVIGRDRADGPVIFCDCARESPAGRRSLCYDRDGLESRAAHRPEGCAVESAAAMGVALLSESEYRALQELDEFDLRTSSWIQTPPEVRSLGGALFADRRYGRVFVYHNGAQAYFAARGFRGLLRV